MRDKLLWPNQVVAAYKLLNRYILRGIIHNIER